RPETRQAAPPSFATPTLGLPALSDVAPGDARQPAAGSPADEPSETRGAAERSDQAARAAGRDSFQPAFQASLADDTASTGPTAAAVATAGGAVGAETRAIHAAYRAPVQQINMPQMA